MEEIKSFNDYVVNEDWEGAYQASLTDSGIRAELLNYLTRNPVLQRSFALRTKFLDRGVSFEAHLENLRLKFLEYDWTPLPENKTFQIIRIIKEMLNFELEGQVNGKKQTVERTDKFESQDEAIADNTKKEIRGNKPKGKN